MSGPFEHPAQVILKGGLPCFFADFEGRPWSGYNLTVEVNKGSSAGMAWVVSTPENTDQPATVESCVRYGQVAGSVKTIKAAMPLRDGLPYLGIIDTGGRARYGVRFCMSKDAQGNPVFTQWNKEGDGCSTDPLSENGKPSFLKHLFGK